MPKVIENLRERILAHAKSELLEKGYDALNIRAVAKECGIAVGTMYNYYPSKEMLAAFIMMDDWRDELERMRAACSRSLSVEEALSALYDGVTAFSSLYRSVWSGYNFSQSAKSEYGARHNLLVLQLAECLKPVLERFPAAEIDGFDVFLAENVLICTGGSELKFDEFKRIVNRILK